MFILAFWTLQVTKVSIIIVNKKLRPSYCDYLAAVFIYSFFKSVLTGDNKPLYKVSGLVFKMCNIIFSNTVYSWNDFMNTEQEN